MKINTTANAARTASPIAPMKPLQVKTGVRAGISGRIGAQGGGGGGGSFVCQCMAGG